MLRLKCAVDNPSNKFECLMTFHLFTYKHRWHKKQYVNFFLSAVQVFDSDILSFQYNMNSGHQLWRICYQRFVKPRDI